MTEERRIFIATVRFDNPMEAQLQVGARDIDHAREILQKQFASRTGFEIIDLFDMVALEKAHQEMDALEASARPGVIEDVDYEDITPAKKVIN